METLVVFEYSYKSLYAWEINNWLLEIESHTCILYLQMNQLYHL